MNCLRCNTPNEEGAKFCKNCGMDLHTTLEAKANTKTSDTLLIVFVSIVFVTAVAQFAMQKLVDNWYESPTKYIQGALWILQNLCFILIPLAIRNKSLKIVGLIITLIMVVYWVYSNVDYMTR
ncbi:MAG: zinc ribbon domain-containing protein [Nitrososphaerales archaeon]